MANSLSGLSPLNLRFCYSPVGIQKHVRLTAHVTDQQSVKTQLYWHVLLQFS